MSASPTQGCVIPAIPMNESERQAALDDLKLIDSPQEERFDRIVQLAQLLFRVPIAYIALIDKDRQWFKSKVGIEANETSRSVSSAVMPFWRTRRWWCRMRCKIIALRGTRWF